MRRVCSTSLYNVRITLSGIIWADITWALEVLAPIILSAQIMSAHLIPAHIKVRYNFWSRSTFRPTTNSVARMPRKELLPSRSSFLRTARNFLKELPRNKDGEDLPRGTSLRRGGEGWQARKFLKERMVRMARIFLDARKFLASRKFLEIRMAIEELP